MLLRRRHALSALLLAAAAVATGVRLHPGRPISIEPEIAYEIETPDGVAVVDLPFESNTRYRLIVASLGEHVPDGSFPVQISAEPIPAIERQAMRPFRPRPPRNSESNSSLAVSPVRPKGPDSNGAPVARERDFSIHVTEGDLDDPRQYVRVRSRLVREGRTVRVYLDRQIEERRLAADLIDEIVRLCDDEVLPPLEAHLGPCLDVDGDGRLAILLSPWLGALQGGRTSIGGFVRSADFRVEIVPPVGNQADVLYVNTSLSPGPHLKTLLAHELTHAICASARAARPSHPVLRPDEDDWVSEGLAHLSENRFGGGWSNLDHRACEFLHQPARYPLVVPDYYRSGLWRNHGCRGATWLFHRWCADEFGDEIAKRLACGPATGAANIEQATGVRFDELVRRWTLALLRSTQEDLPVGDRTSERYRSVDLCGRLGRFQLAGPRIDAWDADGPPATLSLAGTAAVFLELSARAAGPRRIRIHAPPSARLQVTLVRRREDRPRVELDAFWEGSWEDGRGGAESGPLALRVMCDRPRTLRVESIALDGDTPGDGNQVAWSVPAESGPEDPPGESNGLGAPLIVRVTPPRETILRPTLKVVLRTDAGERIVAWAACPPRPSRLVAVRMPGAAVR